MIDIHIHILPGVDDGSYSMGESLRMAQLAVEAGVTQMVTTPHCNLPENPDHIWAPEFRVRLRDFQQELDRQDIPLKLYPGMEIYGKPNTPRLLEEGRLMPLADSRYPLIEFPFSDYGREATRLLGEVLELGYRPIVAHPERYHFAHQDPEIINIWAEMGCFLQINRGSLFGKFGAHAEEMAYELLDRGFVSFVATDAHRSDVRTPWLRDAYELLCDEYSHRMARRLTEENPLHVLHNEDIETEEPDWF